jgi:hypothetical protein
MRRKGAFRRRRADPRPERVIEEWLVPPDEAREHTPPGEFSDLFFAHAGAQAHKLTHYFRAYDEQFGVSRGRPVRFLEIGVNHGGSLELWRKYFGPEASIWGIDINPRCASLQGEFEVRIGSQDDPTFLLSVVKEMGGVDIVLDDGSHVASHQRSSFTTLFPVLADGGIYAIEDLCTSYWPGYEGGLDEAGGFLETVKDLIDDMHRWYHDGTDAVGIAAWKWIPRITVYDSMAFVRKERRDRPVVTKVGTPLF